MAHLNLAKAICSIILILNVHESTSSNVACSPFQYIFIMQPLLLPWANIKYIFEIPVHSNTWHGLLLNNTMLRKI